MFNLDPSILFFSIIFSAIGIGYYSYGKKHNVYFQLTGVALLVFTMFVGSLGWLIGVGTLLTLLPFMIDRFF